MVNLFDLEGGQIGDENRSSSPPLGGAISSEAIHKMMGGSVSLEEIRKRRTFSEKEPREFYNFLSKFKILDEIQWNTKTLTMAIEQVCWDIAKERIAHVELKLSVDKYSQQMHCGPKEVSEFIYKQCLEESQKHGFQMALVLCLKYEANRERQKEIAKLVEDPDVARCFIGIDLVGDEAYYDSDFYADILRPWKQVGKGLVAHVGETQSAENVRTAIEKIGVRRVAHGIQAFHDPSIRSLAKERDVCFDVALSSNLYTGVVPDLKNHPVRFLLEHDVPFTIGTDDPTVLDTTLDKEYGLLSDAFGLNDLQLISIIRNSAKYAFGGKLI